VAFKRKLYRWFKIVRYVKTWQLFLLLILLVFGSAYFLRQNSLGMDELRTAVKTADEEAGDTKQALLNLQHYVAGHMNTSLGEGIVLQSAYQKAYNTALQKSLNYTNPNSQLYTQVELECRAVFKRTHSFPAYTQCAHEKLSKLAPGQDPLSSFTPPASDLFHYNYASPAWSPDLAGFSVLLTVVVAFVLVGRAVAYVAIRAILRSHL
jgi:hypothetical protein